MSIDFFLNSTMKYWQFFDLNSADVDYITSLYNSYVEKHPPKYFFSRIDLGIESFLNRPIARFCLTYVIPYHNASIHIDTEAPQLALQIPFRNCNNTFTNFWYTDEPPIIKLTENNRPYEYFERRKCKLITRFSLTRPAFINVKVPHNVENPTELPRLAISIRWVEDPWDLVPYMEKS
jgi:hypothetical protein